MENKNTILLTIIAIATLLVAVVGATFAYFASNIQNNGNVGINVNTSNKQAVFLSSAEGDLTLNIDSYMMQQHDAVENAEQGNTSSNETIEPSLSSNANINVSLNANGTGGKVECTYDLIYEWDTNSSTFEDYQSAKTNLQEESPKIYPSKYYLRSEYKKDGEGSSNFTDNFREITLSGTSTTNPAVEGGSSTELFVEGEKNIDEFECVTESVENGNECQKLYLKKGETIATESEANVRYELQLKFYNLKSDQSSLMDKHFKGQIKVANVKC